MKTIILLLLSTVYAFGQGGFVANGSNPYAVEQAERNQQIAEGRAAALLRDPWRQFGSNTVMRTSERWTYFYGVVTGVTADGIIIDGNYAGFNGAPGFQGEFLVANYPDQAAVGDRINMTSFYLALLAGTYTYTTAAGGSRTIHKLDYGKLYIPPPLTPEQIEAQKKAVADAKVKANAAKLAGEEKALAANQAAADKGDAYGLLRMGERYRDGEGVEKDPAKAKDYLTKAAAAGSPTAQDELKRLGN